MGASYVSHSIDKCTANELSCNVDSLCQEAAHEFGHGPYSGDWGEKIDKGVRHVNKTFNSYFEADIWLQDNAEKWGALLAVKVLKPPKCLNTKIIDSQLEAVNAKIKSLLILAGERSDFGNTEVKPLMNTILERVKSGKSKFKGCDYCGSKVSTAHLKHHVCPVCGNKEFLLTDTDKKKLHKLNEKLASLKADIFELENKRKSKINEAIKADKNKNNWGWLVGGLCSC